MARSNDGGDSLPISVNSGYICGAYWEVSDIPQKLRGSRARWVLHPEKSDAGPCEECKDMAGKFFAMEEIVGLQPLHPNCVCGAELEPAQPGVGSGQERSYVPWSFQARHPELWNRAWKKKREAFAGGGCGH